ncbi:MAG: methyltransferase domain-containing protein [Methyloprofundus sp.]|nr:methyltransferase domain-containing protein [Methyloprofundus sp.]MBW6453408.1 class I SAM-dependent methyltransferase [Methyloprofundus sp.]
MHRKVLIDWFTSAKGQVLQRQEAAYLTRSITASCKQVVLQIGALGWENQFIDCSLYKRFYVLDDEQFSWHESKLLRGANAALPLQSDSVDMIILPHLLEFDSDKHQVLREVERILKPEGKLIILGFNPWNIYINLQYFWHKEKGAPWLPSLVSRTKIEDWLRLLNFEVEIVAGFNFDASRTSIADAEQRKNDIRVAAYAIRAIKRRYHLIPLTPVKKYQSKLAMARIIDMPFGQKEYDKNS